VHGHVAAFDDRLDIRAKVAVRVGDDGHADGSRRGHGVNRSLV
jgi:hypothetical protein